MEKYHIVTYRYSLICIVKEKKSSSVFRNSFLQLGHDEAPLRYGEVIHCIG